MQSPSQSILEVIKRAAIDQQEIMRESSSLFHEQTQWLWLTAEDADDHSITLDA